MRTTTLAKLMLSLLSLPAWSAPPPSAPTQATHPGSKIYSYEAISRNITCEGRAVTVVLPAGLGSDQKVPVVTFGHGQALGASAYQATFTHLARKGVAVVFPAYDSGFFDQDWARMGRDFVTLTECAVNQVPALDPSRIVYAGHSKGAYVASIAAGLAPDLRVRSVPRAIVLLEPAGADSTTLPRIPAESALTVVFAEQDTVVSRSFSDTIFARAGSRVRQLILMKSYRTSPALPADHMWPLTEKSFFGGGPESALHYYGSWKWLVAAALDLGEGNRYTHPFLYGEPAVDKGIPGETDERRVAR